MKENNSSTETQVEAMKIAKAIQKPKQTKAQTKLIAQGIEKGITEYKKKQKVKSREQDKKRKKDQKALSNLTVDDQVLTAPNIVNWRVWLPWVGLAIMFSYFVIYPLIIEN